MRMRKKAPVLRSVPSPMRKAAPASPSLRRPAPAAPLRQTKPQARRRGGRSGRNRLQRGRGQGSRRADLSAPLIPLTLRAMPRTPHLRDRASALPVAALLSALAVLAFACSPAFAHAEEATGPQYESDVPA